MYGKGWNVTEKSRIAARRASKKSEREGWMRAMTGARERLGLPTFNLDWDTANHLFNEGLTPAEAAPRVSQKSRDPATRARSTGGLFFVVYRNRVEVEIGYITRAPSLEAARVAAHKKHGGKVKVSPSSGLARVVRAPKARGLVTSPSRALSRPLAPSRAGARAARDPDDLVEYNGKLAKLMTRLKKDAGATTIRQNYRGTGSRKARRQLWIHFKSGAVIDVWLDEGFVQLGGVVVNRPPGSDVPLSSKGFRYNGSTPEEVYGKVAAVLKPWANPALRAGPSADSRQPSARDKTRRERASRAARNVLYGQRRSR